MEEFVFYLKLGWEHIISVSALDHILFITCLAIVYLPSRIKELILLLTAFTIGHSVTLALNVWQVITVNEYLVEILIPATIVVTAALNIFYLEKEKQFYFLKYFLATVFGLFHGLGYASTLRFLLAKDQSIGWPLFGFNLGLEFGQILVAAVIIFINLFVLRVLKIKAVVWIRLICVLAILTGLFMIWQRV